MSYLAKSLMIRIPCDKGRVLANGNPAPNDFGCQKFAVTAASQAFALPKDWSGRFVIFYTPTGSPDIEIACSLSNAATVNAATAATAGGLASVNPTSVGFALPAAQEIHRILPSWDRQENGFLIMQSSGAATTVRVYLADGNQG